MWADISLFTLTKIKRTDMVWLKLDHHEVGRYTSFWAPKKALQVYECWALKEAPHVRLSNLDLTACYVSKCKLCKGRFVFTKSSKMSRLLVGKVKSDTGINRVAVQPAVARSNNMRRSR